MEVIDAFCQEENSRKETLHMENNKLGARDFINIGIFLALLFVVEFAVGMLGFIHPLMVVAYVAVIPVICGIPMMLFYTKIEKFGMLTIFALLLAGIMFFTGMGWIGGPVILLCGLAADLIAKKGRYKSRRLTVLSYGVFSMWVACNYLLIVLTAESYGRMLSKGGYSGAYVNTLLSLVNGKTLPPLFLACFVFGIVGGLLGRAVVRKHFEKAGIA